MPNAVLSGRPTFLPRPGAHPDDETDGVLIVDFLSEEGALFVILSVRTFTEVARICAPFRHCESHKSHWVWGAAAAGPS